MIFWRLLFAALSTGVFLVACAAFAPEPQPTPTPALSAEAQLGQQVFTRQCASCHSLAGETVIVGPALAGIARRAGARVPGMDAHTYLLTSIMNPGEYLVEGFQNLMPATFGRTLTGEEIDALVAFMMTLE